MTTTNTVCECIFAVDGSTEEWCDNCVWGPKKVARYETRDAVAALRQGYAEQLFVIVRDSLEAAQPWFATIGFDIPAINPNKITGVIIEGATLVELHRLLVDSPFLAEVMLEACDLLVAATT